MKIKILYSTTILILSFLSTVQAAPWKGYGRTYHSSRYESAPEAQPGYSEPNAQDIKSFSPYRDPDLRETANLEDPFKERRYDSYNVIVIINSSEKPSAEKGYPQRLRVYKRGQGLIYYWGISTGMVRYETARGYFTPQSFSPRHWSDQYDAPMLSSVFFHGGMALHSSMDTGNLADLGVKRASHGCVHIEDHRAEVMYHVIGNSGFGSVDFLNPKSGSPEKDDSGRIKQKSSYKTLIIVQ
jgi:hypothetical protein